MPLTDISNIIETDKDHIIKGAKLILNVLSTIKPTSENTMNKEFYIRDSSLSIFNVDYISSVSKLDIWKNYKIVTKIMPVRGSEIPGVFLCIKSNINSEQNHTVQQILEELTSIIEQL